MVGTLVTALVAGVALVAVKLLSEKLRRYLPLPIPGELLTVRGRAGAGERGCIPAGAASGWALGGCPGARGPTTESPDRKSVV